MKFTETHISGAYVIDLDLIADDRGFFARAWCQREFKAMNLESQIKQSNLCHNKVKGIVRGLHYQIVPFEEVKIVRCLRGSIFDVIVDIRKESPTYLQHYAVELTAENRRSIYVPKGCAHGYQSLEDDSEVFYLTTEFYHADSERSARWNDPAFNIPWPEEVSMVSDKDASAPDWKT